jgi:amino acid adenylation domain-containing protein
VIQDSTTTKVGAMSCGDVSREWAVSHAQRRLWVVNSMLEGAAAAAYNMPVALRLRGPLDVNALRNSFEVLQGRHEALRTTFSTADGEPRQRVHERALTSLREVDLSDGANAEQMALQWADRHASTPFDLAEGPLVRATVIRLAPTDWVLLFNIHHIVFDEWSLGVMVHELSNVYASNVRQEEISLPELPIQYKDYAAWQNKLLAQEDMQRHHAYWRGKFSGSVPALSLPADFSRPALKSYDARAFGFYLNGQLTAAMTRFAARHRTTLFTTLAAIVKTLLFRYTGQEDITIGCPVAGREHPALQNQVGLYVNTLALRDFLSSTDTFVAVLEKVKKTVGEALEHQIYPFDKLVGELSIERDVSRSALFDVSINLNSADLQLTAFELPGIEVNYFDHVFTMAKVDLSFDFSETPAGLQLTLIYSTALYTDERIRRLAGHFEQLVTACISAPESPIRRLDFLTESEKKVLIHQCNATTSSFPDDRTFIDLFEEQVVRTPELSAIAFQGTEITYEELNSRANGLANHLRSQGIGPEVPVGVFLDRSPELIIAMLAIWKSGGAYVPLDTTVPIARLAEMVKGCLLPIIVTDSSLEDKLPAFLGAALCLDTDLEEFRGRGAGNPERVHAPDNAAYLIYTSGSTGVPKAVVIEHRGLSNLSEMQLQLFGLHPGDRVLQFASPSFDASIFEVVMALRTGAVLCPGSRDALLPGSALLRFLSENHINIVTLPPSALAMLPADDLPDLRTVIVAGEACSPDLPVRWGPPRRFFNLYGPTEATVWSAAVLYESGRRPPSIGTPISNTGIHLVDAGFELVPHGNPGEICIGGVGVGRGYLNRPDLTAEKFVPNPFGGPAGSRLYRTADIGRRLDDGSIDFLGRADHQVKVRGYRIELGEIEAVLAQHPCVQSAVVVHREDKPGDRLLAAYVLPVDATLNLQELRSWLRTYLPEYMVPAAITPVQAFPLAPNGKINRKALPDPNTGPIETESAFVCPRTDLESALVRLFSDVLGRERVSVTDNFFDIGGHSLLATQVVSRIREFLFVELPLSRFFQSGSVAQIAEALQAIEPEKVDKVARALERLRSMPEEQKQQLRIKRARR